MDWFGCYNKDMPYNEYPVQSWLQGVIVKRGRKYLYKSDKGTSPAYESVTELVEKEGNVPKKKAKATRTKRNDTSDNRQSKATPVTTEETTEQAPISEQE